jgi:hypothetical protein
LLSYSSVLERLTIAARARARREAYRVLTSDLTTQQTNRLEGLLEARGESRQAWLGWLRHAIRDSSITAGAPAPAIDTILPVTSQQKVGAPIEAGGKNVDCSSNLSVPRCSDALRRIKISRAQMLASGRSSPSMVGMSSEMVG